MTAIAAPGRLELPFVSNLDSAQAAAAESGRPVVVLFKAVWCPVCREMGEHTLRQPEVLALEDDFEWVEIDIDRNLNLARGDPRLEVGGCAVRHARGGADRERGDL